LVQSGWRQRRIGLRRARLVDDLKEALMAHDTSRVYEAGRKVCGLEAEKEP
jgi:hypothetical protein